MTLARVKRNKKNTQKEEELRAALVGRETKMEWLVFAVRILISEYVRRLVQGRSAASRQTNNAVNSHPCEEHDLLVQAKSVDQASRSSQEQ